MMDFEIVSIIVFVAVIGGLLLKDRKNVKFHYGIIIRRWTRGLEFIDKLVKSYPTLIRRLGNIGVGIGILAGIAGTVILIFLTLKLQQTFGLVLPTTGGYQIPGPVFSVPFWYWLIAIFIIAITHETMHAVFIRLEKVPVRNYGILMLLLLPIGAFVDPDNRRVNKLSTLKKLRIFAAGSFANFAVAIVAIGIFISSVFAFGSVTNTSGVIIDSVTKDSPADKGDLEGVIERINDVEIKNTLDFAKSLNTTKPSDEIQVTTNKGDYKIMLEEHPKIENRSYIGVTIRNSYEYNIFGLSGELPLVFMKTFFAVMSFLNWLFLISFGVGIVNLLPVKPLDGGLLFGEIFTKLFKEKGTLLINITTILLIGIFLFNLFGIHLLRNIIG